MRSLTSTEAQLRLATHGANALPELSPRSLANRVLAQLHDPMILLLAAGALTALYGDLPYTVIIALVVVVNTSIGVVQRRAEPAIAALRTLVPHGVRVRRDSVETVVEGADLCPDIVFLRSGDVIPADCMALAPRFFNDESATTSESVPFEVPSGDELTRVRQGGTFVKFIVGIGWVVSVRIWGTTWGKTWGSERES